MRVPLEGVCPGDTLKYCESVQMNAVDTVST